MQTSSGPQADAHAGEAFATTAWTVFLKLENPHGELPIITNRAKGNLINGISGSNVIVGTSADFLAVTMTILAADHRTASQIATASCDDGLVAAGLPVLSVVDCRAARTELVEREMDYTPDLIGVSEIADLLGVSKQRAWQVTKTQEFPAEACRPKAGPLWWKASVLGVVRKRAAER